MLLIGLTGSIATGKSTVSALLTSPPYSLPLIDADLLARKAVEPGTTGYERIVQYFGPSTPDLLVSDGGGQVGGEGEKKEEGKEKGEGRARPAPLNRAALGRRVFGDSEEKKRDRKVLNGIIHPAVRWEIYRSLLHHYVRGRWAVVLDVPLLFESGLDLVCGTVVVVAVGDAEVQMQRLLDRDRGQGGGMTRDEAEGRVRSQWDVRDKARRCEARKWGDGDKGGVRGLVIWNDGDKAQLKETVSAVMDKISKGSPRWWSWICLLVPPVGFTAAAWQMARNLMDRSAWERRQTTEKAKL